MKNMYIDSPPDMGFPFDLTIKLYQPNAGCEPCMETS